MHRIISIVATVEPSQKHIFLVAPSPVNNKLLLLSYNDPWQEMNPMESP